MGTIGFCVLQREVDLRAAALASRYRLGTIAFESLRAALSIIAAFAVARARPWLVALSYVIDVQSGVAIVCSGVLCLCVGDDEIRGSLAFCVQSGASILESTYLTFPSFLQKMLGLRRVFQPTGARNDA